MLDACQYFGISLSGALISLNIFAISSRKFGASVFQQLSYQAVFVCGLTRTHVLELSSDLFGCYCWGTAASLCRLVFCLLAFVKSFVKCRKNVGYILRICLLFPIFVAHRANTVFCILVTNPHNIPDV
mmetsp:Transcript_106057/g.329433  ORF Transcript_106057/g.329433 Transcript_106057/m.329433 type:complete len:128 (-) Transcript_106057:297-680(-)